MGDVAYKKAVTKQQTDYRKTPTGKLVRHKANNKWADKLRDKLRAMKLERGCERCLARPTGGAGQAAAGVQVAEEGTRDGRP